MTRCYLRSGVRSILLAVWIAGWVLSEAALAQPHAIDTAKSTMTIRVYKSGVFSAFGHNHEIAAPIAEGKVDATARQVELHVDTRALKVLDPGVSGKDLAETQKVMLGAEVLSAEAHPTIVFRSTSAEPAGAGAWKVHGNLTVHGQTRAVDVDVRQEGDHYVGTSRFKQTEFGIQPVKVAGGTIRVKDEIRIEFNIQLAR